MWGFQSTCVKKAVFSCDCCILTHLTYYTCEQVTWNIKAVVFHQSCTIFVQKPNCFFCLGVDWFNWLFSHTRIAIPPFYCFLKVLVSVYYLMYVLLVVYLWIVIILMIRWIRLLQFIMVNTLQQFFPAGCLVTELRTKIIFFFLFFVCRIAVQFLETVKPTLMFIMHFIVFFQSCNE